MSQFNSPREYAEWTQRVAINNWTRDGAEPQQVAEVAVRTTRNIGDEVTMTITGEPYLDSDQTRLFPKDVIDPHPPSDYDKVGPVDSLRDLAVKLLAMEIEKRNRELLSTYKEYKRGTDEESISFREWVDQWGEEVGAGVPV